MKKYILQDCVGRLIAQVTDHWLLSIRETNPAILTMLRDKNLLPARHLNPWSGEFAGKYLTGCALIYRLTNNNKLKKYIKEFIDEMLAYQEPNGYLGAFGEAHQLTGTADFMRDPIHDRTMDTIGTWDAWAHYHMMVGLMLWHDITNDEKTIKATERIAGLFIDKFYGKDGLRIVDTGSSEMNLAVYHGFALLYNHTGNKKYLDFALKIEEDTRDPRAGNYMQYSQDGMEFFECPKPRWESLHVIMGYAEMYHATGDQKYLSAVTQITRSILKTDIHNTGGFSTNEQAIGNPFSYGAIETCCVVAYNALAAEVYSLTLDPVFTDFLELSLYNAVMGSFSVTGRWSTYDTPMDGCRRANYHSIVFQSRPGSPDLNCCSVNAHRALGELERWAVYENNGMTYINWYGQSEINTENVCYTVSGDYPYNNEVIIKIESNAGSVIALRIPAWSEKTEIILNNERIEASEGTYLTLGILKTGDTIKIRFDFKLRLLYGEGDRCGFCSVYRGPLLLGFDSSMNPLFDFDAIPIINLNTIETTLVKYDNDRLALTLSNGIILNDFYNLGQSGSAYRTWLPI
ncbi:MAG: beta-L-arabinofuranosidase domain-containing protein [Eubacteriales bacterium]